MKNFENSMRESISQDTIIGMETDKIDCCYCGTDLIVRLRNSVHAHHCTKNLTIRQHKIYQWIKNILDKAGISTSFEDHTNQTPTDDIIILALLSEHVAELVSNFETNCRLET